MPHVLQRVLYTARHHERLSSLAFLREERPIPHHPIDVIVAGLHLRWSGVWQRPHHLLSRAAREIPVIVLEEALLGDDDDHDTRHEAGVTIVTPRRRVPAGDAVDGRSLAAISEIVGDRRALVWLYTPMMLALAENLPDAPLVFDKMDELAAFVGADPRIGAREDALLLRADAVFTGGRSLQRSVAGRTGRARCYPSGVDVEHFARARTITPHAALRSHARPVLIYVGVIDERVDLALVAAIADAYPASTLAMVGPVVKIDPATLPRRPNIVYLGQRGYEELPALLAAADVALMPFALNRHTANISPTKTLEYLAAGLPVVSTAVPDVVAEYEDIVHVASDGARFVELIATAQTPDDGRAQRAASKVDASGWNAIWESMRGDLAAAGISRSRGAASAGQPAVTAPRP